MLNETIEARNKLKRETKQQYHIRLLSCFILLPIMYIQNTLQNDKHARFESVSGFIITFVIEMRLLFRGLIEKFNTTKRDAMFDETQITEYSK